MRRCCPSVRLSVCLSPKCKNAIFSKTKQYKSLWSLVYWLHIGSRTWAFQRTHYVTPKIQDGGDPLSWKSTWRHFFCWGWSDLDKISETGAEWHVVCGDVVEIETRCRIPYGGRLGEFNGMSSQCMVLPPGKFNVMIPELRVTLQGAATGRFQRHVIPEPRVTLQGAAPLWIHCHDSRATCHIARCSHLAKWMPWSCHIAGCKNSVCHWKSPYFFVFSAV